MGRIGASFLIVLALAVLALAVSAFLLLPARPALALAPTDLPRFAHIFGDHAVLQRDRPIRLWGLARPRERLLVGFGEQRVGVIADARGRWRVELGPMRAGGPYRLTLGAADEAGKAGPARQTALNDIMIGDVYLCSGQSNMEFKVKWSTNAWGGQWMPVNDNIRFTTVEQNRAPLPADDLESPAEWKVAGPKTTADASAVCYYMAEAIEADQKVAIGMIASSWGGTPAQAWISAEGLRRLHSYDADLDALALFTASPDKARADWAARMRQPPAFGVAPRLDFHEQEPWSTPNGVSVLYNAMIAPIAPFPISAVAWYQGETDARQPREYARLLPALMRDWREAFQQPDLPFLIVQLANYGPVATRPGQSDWAELRDVQRRVVDADAHAALTVSIDFGDRSDIHPAQKTIIGQRLARNARAVVYGRAVDPGGPEAVSVTRSGPDLVISFRYLAADKGGKLLTYSSDMAIGFEVCARDVCKYATAVVDNDRIVLKGANTPQATSVRYAWADSPFVNLFNGEDLPAVPFQLDIAR
ncbi:MAG: sialate O-acetylesterase [Erythrobacter sp.]|jgi:sialate O-acetylesterase